jgi:phospholipid-transporting ATPase
MKMMNYMLYTVFAFQVLIISVFASLSVAWISEKGERYSYLDMHSGSAGAGRWFIQLLTYWVAYSHMIPISLYVIIEVLKLVQSYLVKWDPDMVDAESKQPAECRNSDLVEELGQVDFIFSDKTGTLTCNKMVFKKCSVGGKVYSAEEGETNKADLEESKSNNEEIDMREKINESNGPLMNHDTLYNSSNTSSTNPKLLSIRKGNPSLTEFFKFMAQ